jgi:tetratricopeptide (TPR) repeat protein
MGSMDKGRMARWVGRSVISLGLGATSALLLLPTTALPTWAAKKEPPFPVPVVLDLPKFTNPLEEVQALGALGLVAWNQSETPKVRAVNDRLQIIQATSPPDIKLLNALGLAYRQIRKPEQAIAAYKAELALARSQNLGPLPEFKILNSLGELHLEWFGYARARQVYEELLAQADLAQDGVNQVAYLYQLAYIHEESRQPTQAAEALRRLIPLYQAQAAAALPVLLPWFQLRLGDNYRLVKDFEAAEKSYQAGFNSAQSLVQFSYAQENLHHLGELYEAFDRTPAALQVYDYLSTFEQNDLLDFYNALNSYDRLGQLHLKQGDKPRALVAFGQGLAIAQRLNSRVAYFEGKVQALQGKPESIPPKP